MTTSTPWGKAHVIKNCIPGIEFVIGINKNGCGIRVEAGPGFTGLSAPAIKRAIRHEDHYYFGMEGAFLIPLYEVKGLRPVFIKDISSPSYYWGNDEASIESRIVAELNHCHPDYLAEIGVKPDSRPADSVQKTLENTGSEAGVRVIAACKSPSATLLPGIVEIHSTLYSSSLDSSDAYQRIRMNPDVLFASFRMCLNDGRLHYATEESYKRMKADPLWCELMPLAGLDLVNYSAYPKMECRLRDYTAHIATPYIEKIESGATLSEVLGAFSNEMKSVKFGYIHHLVELDGHSVNSAESLFELEMKEIKQSIHPALRGASIFNEHFRPPSAGKSYSP